MTIEKAIAHFEYGVTHDIYSEAVTSYAKAAIAALRAQQEAELHSETASHSEAAILSGCISLMQELMGRFEEYLDFIGLRPDDANEEERFCTKFYMTEVVERLFLWETHHSGGTSQRMKLKELGVDEETVTFRDNRENEEC